MVMVRLIVLYVPTSKKGYQSFEGSVFPFVQPVCAILFAVVLIKPRKLSEYQLEMKLIYCSFPKTLIASVTTGWASRPALCHPSSAERKSSENMTSPQRCCCRIYRLVISVMCPGLLMLCEGVIYPFCMGVQVQKSHLSKATFDTTHLAVSWQLYEEVCSRRREGYYVMVWWPETC